jgi:CheY-like chemotaxis protein
MPRILFVDDDASLRHVFEQLLRFKGYHIICAENGKIAIAAAKHEPLDLVITDILMPDMDGLELIMALHTLPDPPRIIAISGGGRMVDSTCLLNFARIMKVDKIIYKPFDIATIDTAISEVLGIGQACQA